jgi:cobalt-zinc-cadmium efflux system membrane fusion protein
VEKSQLTKIVIVIAIGVVLGGLILVWGKGTSPASPGATRETPQAKDKATTKEGNTQSEFRTGPKGGKLFTTDNFSVEVTIFEKGVPPQFRLYLYQNGKPLPPTAAKVAITLSRLGAPVQLFKFTPEADYLLGDQVVEEPHSFEVALVAEQNGKTVRWGYSQVEARVEMPDEMLKSIGVEILTAGPATIKPTLKLPGEIVFNPDSIVQVVPRLSGVVVAVNHEPGQQVRKGEVLAVIESQILADLRSQFFAAQRRLVLARTTYEREKQLWEEKISAKQDYLAAQLVMNEAEIASDLASEKLRALGVQPTTDLQTRNLTRYEIRAPISGLIIARAVALGTALKEDVIIFTVADMSTVWAEITVYPKDLGVIRLGQKATVKATALDAASEGVVSYIGSLVGAQTRTAKARVVLDNKEGHWLPGMFLNVELVAEEIEVPVAVSAAAIQTLRNWSVVFGRYDNYFEARPLELGRSDGRMVEVLKGLSAGEQYAAGNSFAIKADLGKAGVSFDH